MVAPKGDAGSIKLESSAKKLKFMVTTWCYDVT